MSNFKEFDLSRIPNETAIDWLEKAVEKKAKKIFVSLTHGEFKPYFLLPNENEEEKIEKVKSYGDYFPGVIDVDEAMRKLCIPAG